MPLVRVGVRNEYALGAAELYKAAADREDPKAVLDGVAVSGLVGILRQLGDLAEFAAEVFHGLQEQVMITSSRSHKLMARVQRIETALPSLEKSILAQRSHLHFAYTTGSNWHTRSRCEENHFIYSDLPRFIMDSYEKCRGPPRLHLLDKFDPGGPGSCLKRYSDPNFFKRASAGSDEAYLEKTLKDKKGRKIKKKRLRQKNREVSHGVSSFSNYGSRTESQKTDRQTYSSQRISSQEDASCPSSLMYPDEDKSKQISSPIKIHHEDSLDCCFPDEKRGDNCVGISLPEEKTGHISSLDTRKELRQPEEDNSRQSSSSTSLQVYSNGSLDSIHPDEKQGDVYGDISNDYSEEHNDVTWDGKKQLEEGGCRLPFPAPLQTHAFDSAYESSCIEGFSCQISLIHPDEEDKVKEISSPLDIHHEDSLDYCFSDEKRGDSCVGVSLSEDKTDHVRSDGKVKELRRLEEDNSRQSSNGSLESVHVEEKSSDMYGEIGNGYSETHSNGSLDYPIPDENNGDICVDIGNGLSEKHTAYISYSVTQNNNAGPSELTPNESLYSPSQKNQNICFACPDESICVVSDETGSDISKKHNFPAPSCSTLDRKMDTSETTPQKCNDNDENLEPDAQITAAVTHDTVEQIDLLLEKMDSIDLASTDENITQQMYNDDENLETDSTNISADAQVTAAVTHDTIEHIDLLFEKTDHKDSTDFNSTYEKTCVVSDETGSDFFQKQNCPNPSRSTLDGNMDSLDSIQEMCNDDEDLETYGAEAQITASVTLGTVEQMDLPRGNEETHISNYGDTQFAEIDSEADDFVDALNAIDSESESDLDRQTKKQAELDSYFQEPVTKLSPSVSRANDPKPPPETSSVTSVKFWTNGSLLGLEPSKPPDGVLKSVAGVSLGSEDDTFCTPIQSNDPMGEKNGRASWAKESQDSVRNTSSMTTDVSRSGSPMMSPSWSPPLGHMKISFQPTDVFETYKLKLRFPDRNTRQDGSGDMFPSFQLVPEAAISFHDMSSDSDMSDDCLSRESEYNSEQWEHGESSSIKDHEVYAALRRVSSTDSTSTSFDHDQEVANQGASGMEVEEKEDLLHQIRAKSFSLRPTFKAKPTHTTGLPASLNAILEKANAIRQAVGSDGEDDNWSDT